jgi:DNA-binding transcriptional ArsR family regulator
MSKKNQKDSQTLEPIEVMEITSLEVLKILADPFRIQIIESLRGPQTVKTVAQQLGVTPTKLYYHINMLEQHGLVRVVSTRIVSGILEKSYQVSAKSFEASPSFISKQAAPEDALSLATSILDAAKLEMRRAYNSGEFQIPETGKKPEYSVMMVRSIKSLSKARAKTLRDRLNKLLAEFDDDQNSETQDYSLTIAYHPTVTREIQKTAPAKKAGKS